MTRVQLGNALAFALEATGGNLEEAATTLVRLDRAGRRKRTGKARRMGARNPLVDTSRCQPVIAAVAARHGISPWRLNRGRGLASSAIRFEAAWECRQLEPPVSYPVIAAALGMRNHTSALHGVRRHAARLEAEAKTRTPGSGD